MRHKRVTVCNVPYSYEREREKDLYHSFVDEKERRERRHDSFARGKQFSECSLYGDARRGRKQKKKKKKLSFPFNVDSTEILSTRGDLPSTYR